jgi:hypothetical protein
VARRQFKDEYNAMRAKVAAVKQDFETNWKEKKSVFFFSERFF